jgi:ABC-2 type transport system ATP-binding protein
MTSVIELREVTLMYRKHFWQKASPIVRKLSCTINKGEIMALLGLPGAGKTTTLKLITGLVRPTSGSVLVFDTPVPDLAVKKRIGFLPEIPFFYEHLTGYEFLRLHGHLSGMENGRAMVYEVLSKIGLKDMDDIPLRQYSREMLQLIGYGQVMINDPDLLILDEPLRFLNPFQRKRITDLMIDAKKKNKTILFSSSIVPDIEHGCDRVGVLQGGQLTHTGRASRFLKKHCATDEIELQEWIDAITERS